jgi:putative flavoprotein involved in K+ transport
MLMSTIEQPTIVSRAEWLVARKELLAREKELTRERDKVDRRRRDDLALSLQRADSFFDERLRGFIDTYIERAGIHTLPDDRVAVDYAPDGLTELNLQRAGISVIIWATGYALDYQWIDASILDDFGYPENVRGVASIPGLYFLGLLWQHSQASASLVGPEFDGPHLVETMAQAVA